MKKRIAAVLVATTALLALPASAFAHECFNASRSAQGNAGASHSGNWAFTASLTDLVYFGMSEGALPPLSDAQVAEVVEIASNDYGVPTSFTIFTGTHTLAEGTPAMEVLGHAADGKGIDHAFDYVPTLAQIAEGVLGG